MQRDATHSNSLVQPEPIYFELDDVPQNNMTNKTGQNHQIEENTTQDVNISQDLVSIPTLRRSNRPHVPNRKYLNYLLLIDGGEPKCYDEACQMEDNRKWELTMKNEMKSLILNQTWKLVELPMGKKVFHNKWVY